MSDPITNVNQIKIASVHKRVAPFSLLDGATANLFDPISSSTQWIGSLRVISDEPDYGVVGIADIKIGKTCGVPYFSCVNFVENFEIIMQGVSPTPMYISIIYNPGTAGLSAWLSVHNGRGAAAFISADIHLEAAAPLI